MRCRADLGDPSGIGELPRAFVSLLEDSMSVNLS
jgi:hypothetical protein